MAEQPYIAPTAYIFVDYQHLVGHPHVQIEHFCHQPVRTWVWASRKILETQHIDGPDLAKDPRLKIVVPGQTEERVDFEEVNPEGPTTGWYYPSGLIEYDALGRRYCTRFCRYLHLPDKAERLCEGPSRNDFSQDDKRNGYEANLSKPK